MADETSTATMDAPASTGTVDQTAISQGFQKEFLSQDDDDPVETQVDNKIKPILAKEAVQTAQTQTAQPVKQDELFTKPYSDEKGNFDANNVGIALVFRDHFPLDRPRHIKPR